jgi:hypothetical protein
MLVNYVIIATIVRMYHDDISNKWLAIISVFYATLFLNVFELGIRAFSIDVAIGRSVLLPLYLGSILSSVIWMLVCSTVGTGVAWLATWLASRYSWFGRRTALAMSVSMVGVVFSLLHAWMTFAPPRQVEVQIHRLDSISGPLDTTSEPPDSTSELPKLRGRLLIVRGTVSPARANVVVLISPKQNPRWWVQPIPERVEGDAEQWVVTAYVGLVSQDTPEDYHVIALASAEGVVFDTVMGRSLWTGQALDEVPRWSNSSLRPVRRVE